MVSIGMYMSIGVVLSGMVIVGPATFKACSHIAASWIKHSSNRNHRLLQIAVLAAPWSYIV